MSSMGKVAWGLILFLAIIHYDFWLWDSTTLLFGFFPLGLAYHAGISIAAATAWFLVTRFAWPDDVEEWASGGRKEEE
jgi:hypothetical protein